MFSVLRSRNVSLRGNLRPLLELESGSNDPMAVFLTIGFVELVSEPDTSAWSLAPLFVAQLAVGAAAGVAATWAMVQLLNRLRLEYEGLYPVATLAGVVLTYGATATLGGSGFLAVYLLSLGMARHEFARRRSLVRFHGAVAWLAQIGMFLVLGLLVYPSDLPSLAGQSLLIAAGLALVARPVGVFCVARALDDAVASARPGRRGWRRPPRPAGGLGRPSDRPADRPAGRASGHDHRAGAALVLVHRAGGSSQLQAGDELLAIGDPGGIDALGPSWTRPEAPATDAGERPPGRTVASAAQLTAQLGQCGRPGGDHQAVPGRIGESSSSTRSGVWSRMTASTAYPGRGASPRTATARRAVSEGRP